MPARKPWCPRIKGWTLLGEALDLIKATSGSRTEQEICNYLRNGQLPAKYWRQSAPRAAVAAPVSLVAMSELWQDVNPDYWTLENLRKARSVHGVVQGGKRNWYHVKHQRLKELFAPKPGRIDWDDFWKYWTSRRELNELPLETAFLAEAESWIKERYGVTKVPLTELRRHKARLYRGDTERPTRTGRRRTQQAKKRKQTKQKAPSN
jgi:hypothetical protein